MTPGEAFYDAVGGTATFSALTREFYHAVRTDPVLMPMYPADDLAGAEERLRMFLEQYWGGPSTYSDQRGHPRLRLRHAPYRLTPQARDHWLGCMRQALDAVQLEPAAAGEMWEYFNRAANAMVNTPQE